MKLNSCWNYVFSAMMLVSLLVSCDSDDPQYADPETHAKTEELREEYTSFLLGTWHLEHITGKQRFFEQLTFHEDNTISGTRRWQMRQLVTIDGQQQYTDWENVELAGTFAGNWQLRYWSPEGESTKKRNCLTLSASFTDGDRPYMAYSDILTFVDANDSTLVIQGHYCHDADGNTVYHRGEAQPNF